MATYCLASISQIGESRPYEDNHRGVSSWFPVDGEGVMNGHKKQTLANQMRHAAGFCRARWGQGRHHWTINLPDGSALPGEATHVMDAGQSTTTEDIVYACR